MHVCVRCTLKSKMHINLFYVTIILLLKPKMFNLYSNVSSTQAQIFWLYFGGVVVFISVACWLDINQFDVFVNDIFFMV